ncbi:hypothetical protein HZS_2200 [Henneguya salminicola]|nr:hypothetical protein HZS_2200 [Henneguya salminicola]
MLSVVQKEDFFSTTDTLTRIIQTHVLPNSIIHTDCFRSYSNLNVLYDYFTVNPFENFIDLNSGMYTNTIEGTWNSF